MEIQLHNIADPITLAAATGSHPIMAQTMAYEMVRHTTEYPPHSLADAMYIASTMGEMIQKMCPVTMVEVEPEYVEEAAVEEEDDETGFD